MHFVIDVFGAASLLLVVSVAAWIAVMEIADALRSRADRREAEAPYDPQVIPLRPYLRAHTARRTRCGA